MKQAKTAARVAVVIGLAIIALQIDSRPAEAAAVSRRVPYAKRALPSASPLPMPAAYLPSWLPTRSTHRQPALPWCPSTAPCNAMNNAVVDDASHGVIDLTTQIMTGGGTPNFQAPGGSRFTMRLSPTSIPDHSVPVNLASARVVAVTAGANTFSFKIAAQPDGQRHVLHGVERRLQRGVRAIAAAPLWA